MRERKNRIQHKPLKKGIAKTPVIMQMETLECGAASLSMILAYYGKWVPIEKVRATCGVSRDGSNAKNIYKAAASYGLSVKAFRYEVEDIMEEATFPCIIHWGFNHFVVLNGFKGKKAILNDPARGCVKVSMEEFDENFTGVCLIFEPGEEFEPEGKQKSIIRYVMEKVQNTGAAFYFVFIITAVIAVLGLIQPVMTGIFLDKVLPSGDNGWLKTFVIVLSVVVFFQIIVLGIRAVYMLKIEGKLAIVANSEFMWHVLRLPLDFFAQRMTGDIATRQKSNQNMVPSMIKTVAPLIINFFMMLIYLVVMLRYSIYLTLIGIGAIFIQLCVAKIVSEKRINITRVMMRNQGRLDGITFDSIEMIDTIKSSGADNVFFEKWAGIQASVNTQQVEYTKVNQYMWSIPFIVSSISDILILLTGAYMIIKGNFTIGMLLAFQGYAASFREPAEELVTANQTIQEMRTNMERIEDVMDYGTDVNYYSESEDNPDEEYDKLTGKVELKNVTFGYSPLEEPLIQDFNLSIEPGKRVAIVGASGCGKSTVSKLISGLYKPWSGEILYDGKNFKQINHQVFTGSLAVVNQDIILFEDTIANNIKMWDSSIEDYEMILAARDAQLHEDIMQRDGGYQYRILEGGKDLSGGQRQRMEIARVLAQDPTIIIMDEATSALDAKTEYDVVNAIKDRGIACIVIAHRLSTIRDCDEIIVMEKGKIVERGKHEELMENKGLYSQLITNE